MVTAKLGTPRSGKRLFYHEDKHSELMASPMGKIDVHKWVDEGSLKKQRGELGSLEFLLGRPAFAPASCGGVIPEPPPLPRSATPPRKVKEPSPRLMTPPQRVQLSEKLPLPKVAVDVDKFVRRMLQDVEGRKAHQKELRQQSLEQAVGPRPTEVAGIHLVVERLYDVARKERHAERVQLIERYSPARQSPRLSRLAVTRQTHRLYEEGIARQKAALAKAAAEFIDKKSPRFLKRPAEELRKESERMYKGE
jgi:hypothetical protein